MIWDLTGEASHWLNPALLVYWFSFVYWILILIVTCPECYVSRLTIRVMMRSRRPSSSLCLKRSPHLQMRSVGSHSTSGREKKGKDSRYRITQLLRFYHMYYKWLMNKLIALWVEWRSASHQSVMVWIMGTEICLQYVQCVFVLLTSTLSERYAIAISGNLQPDPSSGWVAD